MAISASYVVRETANNLRRNLVMTIGAMLTGAVSLALMGGVLLSRQAVNKQTARWKGGVELSIFMNANATDSQIEGVRSQLNGLIPAEVKKVTYVDHAAALAEMRHLFADNSNVLASLTEQDTPTSFRVVPTKPDLVDAIGSRFTDQPGVMKNGVVYAKTAIHQLITNSNRRSRIFIVFAGIMLLSAILLIGTTIQLAIHARQREVAVMKLVGATNWFIRIPFMLEGMVQGLVGAVVAFLAVYVFRNSFMSVFADPAFGSSSAISRLFVTSQEAVYTGIVLFVIGTLVGAFGSAFAVRRFLTV